MAQRATVVVADPHPVVAEGVRAILTTTTDLAFAATVSSLDQVRETLWRTPPSVLLLDTSFAKDAVAEVLAEAKTASSGTAIVVWGAFVTDAEAVRFLRTGVMGVLRKSATSADLITCLRSAAGGTTYVNSGFLHGLDLGGPIPLSLLTKREQQILEMIAEGHTNRDIATALRIRPGTLKVHLRNIFEKTGIRSRYGLVLAGMEGKVRRAGG